MTSSAKKFSHTLLIYMGLLVAVSIGLLGYLWISQEYSRFSYQAGRLRVSQLESSKKELKKLVTDMEDYIFYKRSQVEERLRENIKSRVYEAHDIASHIFETYKNQKSIDEIKHMVRESLRPVRFGNGNGYYFATSLDGIEQLFPDRPELEGKNLLDMRDTEGAYVIRDMIRLVRELGEGFYSYRWTKPGRNGGDFAKVSYISYFAPFDWFIGTGVYVEDMEEEVKTEVLQRIEKLQFGGTSHIFAGQWDGVSLTGPSKGQNLLAGTDTDSGRVVREFIDHARGDGGYVLDILPQSNRFHDSELKISYVSGVADWQWYIGAGQFVSEFEKSVTLAREEMRDRVKASILRIIFVLISLLLVSLFVARRMSLKMQKSFEMFSSFFEKSARCSRVIDPTSFHFTEFQQLAEAANQMVEERKRVFVGLVENEKRYRTLFDSANDAIFILHNDVIVDCNRQAMALFGCERHEVVGQPPYFFSPERQPDGTVSEDKVKENNKQVLAGKNLFFEWSLLRKDGTPFEAEVNLNSLETSGKVYIQAVVRDITERKRAEKDLARQALAIEQAAEEIIITDNQGFIEYANPAFTRITGYDQVDIVGQTDALLKIDQEDPVHSEMWEVIRLGKTWRGRISIKRKDGEHIEEDVTASPIFDLADRCMGYVFVKRDVTEQVKVDTMLRQSQKMEAIGTLAGGIAHDFNNILAAIFGFAEIAKLETPEKSVAHTSLGKILEAARRARELVKQILTFSRQADTTPQPIKVKIIAKETIKLLKASLPSTIEIRENLQADEAVMADPTSIHQIIMNLSTNAAHAMGKQGGTLDLALIGVELDQDFARVHPDIQPGPFLKLTVKDTGHGMTPEVKERIFDPFFTSKAEGEGTGMGLSVVHGIVSSLGGTITVYSEPDMGSSFNVFLPVYAEAVMEQKEETEPIPTGTERILFVDDEEFIVEIGQQMLSLLGYSVEAKTSSVEALQVFQKSPEDFDLIITDFTMPKMTGIDLARHIRKIRPEVPILLCTGFNAALSEKELKQVGIKSFILKPVVRRELAEAVRNVLDGKE